LSIVGERYSVYEFENLLNVCPISKEPEMGVLLVQHRKCGCLIGQCLPDVCPFSKKVGEIGLFFANYEPCFLQGIEWHKRKKDGEKLVFTRLFAVFIVYYLPVYALNFHGGKKT